MSVVEASLERPALRVPPGARIALLAVLAVVAAVLELALGPVTIGAGEVAAALGGTGDPAQVAIVQQIRLPRAILALAVGAALAGSGMALQGMVRNPLADPGLIGVTAGASFGAVAVIVLGAPVAMLLPEALRPYLLPAAAFAGAGVVTAFVLALSRRGGETSPAVLILGGVAVQAITLSGVGAMIYASDDQQLRDLTFWTMGSLGGADWPMVLAALAASATMVPVFLLLRRPLDLLQLGERAAFHAGLDVERTKRRIGVATAISVGGVTAAAGPIGFIGLVGPHLARLILGPGHRLAMPGAMLMGAFLVLAADLCVRLAIPPAEPPLGLATSLIGGPFFLWLILRRAGAGGRVA